jgi:hypothetical protein
LALSSLDYSLVDRQRVHPSVHLARADDQELPLLLGRPNHLVFLSQNPIVLLVADIFVTAVSYIVAYVAKTLSRPRPSQVEGHQQKMMILLMMISAF